MRESAVYFRMVEICEVLESGIYEVLELGICEVLELGIYKVLELGTYEVLESRIWWRLDSRATVSSDFMNKRFGDHEGAKSKTSPQKSGFKVCTNGRLVSV
jgi:hypothetical protein